MDNISKDLTKESDGEVDKIKYELRDKVCRRFSSEEEYQGWNDGYSEGFWAAVEYMRDHARTQT